MADEVFRGVVHDGMVVFREEDKTPLMEGTEVLVTPVKSSQPGSPAAVLAAIENSPRVPVEWVDELEMLIAQGRRKPTRRDPFGDKAGDQESQ